MKVTFYRLERLFQFETLNKIDINEFSKELVRILKLTFYTGIYCIRVGVFEEKGKILFSINDYINSEICFTVEDVGLEEFLLCYLKSNYELGYSYLVNSRQTKILTVVLKEFILHLNNLSLTN